MSTLPKQTLKAVALASVVFLAACQNSPVRNPFAGYKEPGLGKLPEQTQTANIDTSTAWTQQYADQTGLVRLKPKVVGNTVFVADPIGRLQAIDRNSGQSLWQQNTKYKFSAGPSLVDGKLIVGTNDAQIVAFDAQNGATLWQRKLTSAMLAPAAGGQNIVVIKTIDGGIQGIDNRDGTVLWGVDQSVPSLTLRYHSAPKVINDTVIVGLASGKCLALNLHTGYTIWERTVSLPRGRSELQRMVDISADPIIQNNTVYVVAYQGKLAALHLDTGAIKWEKELSSFQDVVADGKSLYVTDSQYHLWSIEQETGMTLWKQDKLATRNVTAPALVGNKLVVADKEGYLHWVDKRDGKLLGYTRTASKVRVAPISVGNQLFIRTQKGKLAVVNINEGRS